MKFDICQTKVHLAVLECKWFALVCDANKAVELSNWTMG